MASVIQKRSPVKNSANSMIQRPSPMKLENNSEKTKKVDLDVILYPRKRKAGSKEAVHENSAPCNQLVPIQTVPPKASGDSKKPSECCRLCGKDQLLRLIDSCHPCVGDVEQYDAVIKDCFGVDIPKGDYMICEDCVIHLKNTQRFSALVYAAFGSQRSNFSFYNEEEWEDITNKLQDIQTINASTQTGLKNRRHVNKTKIIRIIREKTTRLEYEPNGTDQAVKAIIKCSNCNHKYRINLPQKEWKDFMCSRCKMREEKSKWCARCNANVPIEEYREHFKQHLNNRMKLSDLPAMIKDKSASQPQLYNLCDIFQREYNKKYGCAVCPRRYHTVDGLLDHINCEHNGDQRFGNCVCFVCGKDMKMRTLLDKHMIGHAGAKIFECDTCKQVFRSKKGLYVHKKTHKKFNKFTRSLY